MPEIFLPHHWRPRAYQMPAWNYLERGGKRACLIWHRRSGKDEICLHRAAVAAFERPATYWHMLPEYAQGRKAIWNAVNPHTNKRRIDEAFPLELRANTNDHEMFIRFKNGATWQVVGSDRYDSTVGSPPAGITFSEWALANPAAWGYLAPILRENGGWAIFITTARGRNHAKRMLDTAYQEPGWFPQVLTINDTARLCGEAGTKPPITLADVEEDRRQYHGLFGVDEGDALIEQEYFCSFEAAILGAYYGKLMLNAEQEGRICEFEPEERVPVHTAWDIGRKDSTAIWWWQNVGSKILILDYYQNSGQGAPHYAEEIRKRDYCYERDEAGRIKAWLPHDAKVHEWGTNKSRVETLIEHGIAPLLVPELSIDDGINAARQILPRCHFRKSRTDAKGCEALRAYKRAWDEKYLVFKKQPLHDWASDGADAFRYLAIAHTFPTAPEIKPPSRILTVGPANEVRLDDLWPSEARPSGNPRI